MASTFVRCVLGALALVAAAWLILGMRALALESKAGTVGSGGERASLNPAQLERARSSLRDARLLNADKEPLLTDALLVFAAGRRREGVALARRVVAEEPDYLEGWTGLYYMYSVSGDRGGVARAARKVRALNPLAGDALRDEIGP